MGAYGRGKYIKGCHQAMSACRARVRPPDLSPLLSVWRRVRVPAERAILTRPSVRLRHRHQDSDEEHQHPAQHANDNPRVPHERALRLTPLAIVTSSDANAPATAALTLAFALTVTAAELSALVSDTEATVPVYVGRTVPAVGGGSVYVDE